MEKSLENIGEIKEKINKLKEELLVILVENVNPEEFFDKILEIQNDLISSPNIKEGNLEKEFSKLIKTLNFLNSKQDTQLKETKTKLIKLLENYIETKEKLLEITEHNVKKTEALQQALIELKNDVINELHKKKSFKLIYFKKISGNFFKHPLVIKFFTIFFIGFIVILLLGFTKKYVPSIYGDVKNITHDVVSAHIQPSSGESK